MVGVGRFELPTSCTPSKRASQATLHPEPLEGESYRFAAQIQCKIWIDLLFQSQRPFDAAEDMRLIRLADFDRVVRILKIDIDHVLAMAE